MHKKLDKISLILFKILFDIFDKMLANSGFILYNINCCDIDSVEA